MGAAIVRYPRPVAAPPLTIGIAGGTGSGKSTGAAKPRPGDWRISWSEGPTGFSREAVEAMIENALRARLQDPVEPQLELFSAA